MGLYFVEPSCENFCSRMIQGLFYFLPSSINLKKNDPMKPTNDPMKRTDSSD